MNIQLGTAVLLRTSSGRLGGVPLRAGELQRRRAAASIAWNADRPGLELDEYIDDIPFPETQTYVKQIVGTAEDYRRLYANEPAVSGKAPAPARKH